MLYLGMITSSFPLSLTEYNLIAISNVGNMEFRLPENFLFHVDSLDTFFYRNSTE